MFEKIPQTAPKNPEEESFGTDFEVSRYLEKIDLQKLKGLFQERLANLGLDSAGNIERFIERKDRFQKANLLRRVLHIGGQYIPREEKIVVSEEYFEKKVGKSHEKAKEAFILSLVCHEETHATGFQEHTNEGGLFQEKITKRLGYASAVVNRDFLVRIRISTMYDSLNEGVTDLIGEETYYDYLGKYPGKGEDLLLYESPYVGERLFVETLMKKISEECELEEGVLWKVVQRGYFAGEDLSGERMKRLFQDVFPDQFKKLVAEYKSDPNESSVESLWKQSVWTDEDKKRIRRWMLSVYHTMPKETLSSSVSEKP